MFAFAIIVLCST